MVEFSEHSSPWKTIPEPVAGNVLISKVNVLTYVVLSEAKKEKKTCLMGNQLVPHNVQRYRTNRDCYERVQLYFISVSFVRSQNSTTDYY
jgi:hypothetical protein